MNDLNLDDMSEADNLLKSTEDAIASFKGIQTQLEQLVLLPDYAGDNMTDPVNALT